ncbi:MAG: dienelactone hydrolase family protein [Rhodoferax sp.]|nr:dienelactone hydrolase family protein [Rhodoferax sp.]
MRNDLIKDAVALLSPGRSGGEPSRRTALKLTLGVGYAAAAGPVMAQTAIRTPAEGLRTGTASVSVDGFEVPLYFAAPSSGSSLPVVLVVHEIFGVHEHIADVCRRLARAGYLAVAPELFARHGDPSRYTDMGRLMGEVVSKAGDAQVLADLDGVSRWAAAHGGDAARVGITGFCWGGRITWLYAAHAPVRAGVAWYGRLVGAAGPLTPQHPVDRAAALRAPVLGLYGGADSGIPLDTVDRMKAALAAGSPAARAAQFVVYPDTPHAFHADYRPSYRQAAAEDGWKRCLEWLRIHLA